MNEAAQSAVSTRKDTPSSSARQLPLRSSASQSDAACSPAFSSTVAATQITTSSTMVSALSRLRACFRAFFESPRADSSCTPQMWFSE